MSCPRFCPPGDGKYLLGLILAAQKDYSGAAEQLRVYLKLAPDADDAEKVRTQLGEIEKLGSADHH